MAPSIIAFVVDFKPVPWKRPAGKSVRYDSQVNDKAAFTLKALKVITRKYPELLAEPRPWFPGQHLHVEIKCIFGPSSKDGAAHKKLVAQPDVDNLAKFVLDAMQSQYMDGVVWTDDAQVVSLSVSKCFGETDSVAVTIRSV